MARLPEHLPPEHPVRRSAENLNEEYDAGLDRVEDEPGDEPEEPHAPDHDAAVRAAGMSAYFEFGAA